MKYINDYFLKQSDKVSFIQLKKGSYININDYIIGDDIPLPIVTTTLVKEIKDGNVQEEFKVSQLIEGAIHIIGIDPDFQYKEKYIDVLYNFNPEIEKYILYQGFQCIDNGDYENGTIYFRALININDENIDGIFNYALCLENIAKDFINNDNQKQGRVFLMESTNQLETILELSPDFSLAYYKLGYHYKHYEQFLKSKLTWERYIELNENEDMVQEVREELEKILDDVDFERGLNHLSYGEYNLSLEIYLRLADKYKNSWDIFYLTGLSYKGIGEYENAIDYFSKAIEVDGKNSDVYNELGICLVGIGNMEKGIEVFDKGVELNAGDYKIFFNRGMTYLELGLVEEAKKDIKSAHKLDPENTLIKDQMDSLEIL